MYFGSVRFFKHLILFLLALAILLPSSGLLAVSLYSTRLVEENRSLAEQNRMLLGEFSAISETEASPSAEETAELISAEMEPDPPETASFAYQNLYPDLYCAPPAEQITMDKTVCLTFDDGPSPLTDEILAVLEEHDVKATFFVVGKNTEAGRASMRRIVEAGHSIGVHSYSHEYSQIYASVEAYLDDFYRMYKLIQDATGVSATVFRFPGGSINGYNRATYQQIIAEMTRRGFTYYDWNISVADTASNATEKTVTENVLNSFENFNCGVVLMHDGYKQTLHALDSIIKGIEEKGYCFGTITHEVAPTMFSYRD